MRSQVFSNASVLKDRMQGKSQQISDLRLIQSLTLDDVQLPG